MKKDWEIYRDTGMLGAYCPEFAVTRATGEGTMTTFRDTSCWDRPEGITLERDMIIQGRRFHVTSVFPDGDTFTPTEKMLSLIDADLAKKPGEI